jgi:flagellar hook assembly protein FlgD
MDPDPTGDGWYRAVTGDLTMTASDWRQGPNPNSGAPAMSNLQASTDGAATLVGASGTLFTPNGDGSTDTLGLSYTSNKETFVDWQVQDSGKNVVRSFSSWSAGGNATTSWDGKADNGSYVPDGKYTLTGTPSSRQGEVGTSLSATATVLTTMATPRVSASLFYPQDADSLAPTTTFSVTLTQPAAFTWKVVDNGGNVVRTNLASAAVGAGDLSWTWDGTNDASAYVPDGTYYSVMTAATAAGTYSQKLPVDVKAFRLLTASTAPFVRGTKVKVTVYSAEALSSLTPKPKVRVTLPGVSALTYATTKQADGGFYVTVSFATTAQAGAAQFRVQGTDANGNVQYTDYSFPLN